MAACTMFVCSSLRRPLFGAMDVPGVAMSARRFHVSTVDFAIQRKSAIKSPPPKTTVPPRVGIIGGTGFIGRRLVRRLYELGYNVKVIARRPFQLKKRFAKERITMAEGTRPVEHQRAQRPALTEDMVERISMAGVTQVDTLYTQYLKNFDTVYVELCRASVRGGQIQKALADCDSVVNLVGVLAESRIDGSFQEMHADSAARVAACAKQFSIKRLIHVSAIGASEDSDSAYAKSKAAGEKAVLHYCPSATILRPSIVVGPGDGFFNFFDRMALVSPCIPLVEGGKTRFQPVHIDDLVEAIALALVNDDARGMTYEVGGPEVFTFKELLRKLLAHRKRRRFLMPLPTRLANMFALVSEYMPFTPLLTRDQIRQLQKDNVVSPDAHTLADLGIGDLLTVDEALVDIFDS